MDSDTPGDWALQSIFHFTVSASNFERSLAFYQTLGFEPDPDRRSGSSASASVRGGAYASHPLRGSP